MLRTNTSHFKAKLSHYLQVVRSGQEVIVTDRQTAVARLIPMDKPQKSALIMTYPAPTAERPGDIKVRGVKIKNFNSLDLLKEDRQR